MLASWCLILYSMMILECWRRCCSVGRSRCWSMHGCDAGMSSVVMHDRVRNRANPCVRDMPKYLRTCQMSVHGYPADMSIFCNLQLGLLKLQEDTPQADIDQDNLYLAGVMQGAVGRSLIPRARPPWSRVPLLGDNMRFSETPGTQSGRIWTPFSQSFSVSWTQILKCS